MDSEPIRRIPWLCRWTAKGLCGIFGCNEELGIHLEGIRGNTSDVVGSCIDSGCSWESSCGGFWIRLGFKDGFAESMSVTSEDSLVESCGSYRILLRQIDRETEKERNKMTLNRYFNHSVPPLRHVRQEMRQQCVLPVPTTKGSPITRTRSDFRRANSPLPDPGKLCKATAQCNEECRQNSGETRNSAKIRSIFDFKILL